MYLTRHKRGINFANFAQSFTFFHSVTAVTCIIITCKVAGREPKVRIRVGVWELIIILLYSCIETLSGIINSYDDNIRACGRNGLEREDIKNYYMLLC